jgi:ADP-ribose pyrophosphatase YjhB (NUDIX family)
LNKRSPTDVRIDSNRKFSISSEVLVPKSLVELLDELRAIAQLGLNYTENSYDIERYERLLNLACDEYEDLIGTPSDQVLSRFQEELGYITPKVGVDAAIFDEEGKLLTIQRSDDRKWCLPCGWAEVGDSAREAIAREVQEELVLDIKVGSVIEVFSRKPALPNQPHSSYHLLFHCEITSGSPQLTEEAIDFGYFNPTDVTSWHHDHRERAECAQQFWRSNQE